MIENSGYKIDYDHLVLYYFSGTGNARNCAQWIKADAASKGVNVELINISSIKKFQYPELKEGIVLNGFIYPTHGFNAPPLVLKFLWKFPKVSNSNAFVMNTRGGMKLGKIFTPGLSGIALFLPALILLLKGYRIRALKPVDLPSNWISLHPGLRKKVIDSIYLHWKANVLRFSDKILSGKSIYRGLMDLPLDLILLPIAVLYYFFGRFMLAKTFIATDECTQCNVCIKGCPVKAISMNNDIPFWSFSCESCMRCMNSCPERAIQTSHSFSLAIWYLASLAGGILVARTLIQTGFFTYQDFILKEIIDPLTGIVVTFLFVYIAYKMLHFGLRYNWVNVAIKYTSFTYYRFWRRYMAPREN